MDDFPNANESAQTTQEPKAQFVNVHVRDRQFFKEFMKFSMLRPINYVIYGIMLVFFIFGIFVVILF